MPLQAAPWFAGHLAAWQTHHAARLPKPLHRLLLDPTVCVSSKLVAWLLWSVRHVDWYRSYSQELLGGAGQGPPALSMVRASHAELAALYDVQLRASVTGMQQRVEREVQLLVHQLGDVVDRRAGPWAFDVVKSRTFSAAAPGAGGGRQTISAYVPCADVANHAAWPNCDFDIIDESSSGMGWRFVLRPRSTCAGIDAGQELTISYGANLNNGQLLCSYGFCLPANANDRLPQAWLLPACGIQRQLLVR